ncbi:MAG TPA: Gldg family protein [Planctomycetota bacterium]
MVRFHVIRSIFRRNFAGYFANPTGYVFIAVFVALSGVLAFVPDSFFVNNLANLDTLNRYFPYLLLFFVPAVAMGTWAEERKQGTDELLLTLPVKDLEIVLGKYLAALGIYGVSLVFALANVCILAFLGSPDYGVMLGTYLGYFFLGAGLLALSMAASHLASNMTIAFIFGALACAVPVFLSDSGSLLRGWARDVFEAVGVDDSFLDFAKGVASLKAVLYFTAMAVLFLYVDLVILAKRHVQDPARWAHLGARLASLFLIGITLGVLSGRAGCRVDLTSERLFSLNPATKDILDKVSSERPVTVQAFVSPEVPADYVDTRETLVGLLREIDARGGSRVEVRVVDTVKYSAEAREAETFGIRSAARREEQEGASYEADVYLGLSFRCGAEEVVIPFVQRGMSIEYELTRAIGTVSGAKRKKVGVATTDAKIFGGFDFQSFNQSPEWPIVMELKRQYEVVQVSLDQPIGENYDALIAAQPSSLSQAQMDNLLAYVRKGHGTILLDDPFPTVNPGLVPSKPKGGQKQNNPFAPQPPSEPKGDIRRFYEQIGVRWDPDALVWDSFNPHKQFQALRKELVFVSPASGGAGGISQADPITKGLQELLFFFGGELSQAPGSPVQFTPLLQSSPAGGVVMYNNLFQPGMFGQEQANPFVRYIPAMRQSTLAARVRGSIPAPAGGGDAASINAVVVADLDAMSPWFHQIRDDAPRGLEFDNLTFVLNAVDVVAGDTSYVELRKRRPKHRTLERYEAITKQYVDKFMETRQKADDSASEELKKAQERFDATVAAIEKEENLDPVAKENKKEAVRQMENRRLEVRRREVEDQKKQKMDEAEGEKRRSEGTVRATIKWVSVLVPPIPAVLIAAIVFGRRRAAQRRSA